MSSVYQLCDPTVSPPECIGENGQGDDLGNVCTGTALANHGAPDIATCRRE
ncbi:MAG: hypothetical protein JXA69_20185 [Phycisphaerae bacterium]|nr:hypothetical protein [Phycisphaerae bacterium]